MAAVLVLIAGPKAISSAYVNVGSIALSKKLKATEHLEGDAVSEATREELIRCFLRAVHWDQSNSRAFYDLGVAYSLLGDHERAISFLSIARGLGSDDSLTHLRLAQAHDKLGHKEEAIREYERAIRR